MDEVFIIIAAVHNLRDPHRCKRVGNHTFTLHFVIGYGAVEIAVVIDNLQIFVVLQCPTVGLCTSKPLRRINIQCKNKMSQFFHQLTRACCVFCFRRLVDHTELHEKLLFEIRARITQSLSLYVAA